MPEPRTQYGEIFKSRLVEIDKLQTTPQLVRDIALQSLENVAKQSLPRSAQTIIQNAEAALKNITSGSMASNFRVIYAQMCVLAVSDLEAILKEYFIHASDAYTNLRTDNKKLQQIKVTLEDIISNRLRFGGKIGQLIIDRDKPNFQNLKEIKDTFETYFGKKISMEISLERAACFYLEARHVLVHKGGVVDTKFVEATKVINANLKSFKAGDAVEFDESDWAEMSKCFVALVENVTRQDPTATPE